MATKFDPSDHSHRRYNPLTGEWVLVSPQRTKRPWQGQVEKPAQKERPQHDPNCYLCPGNERAGGVTNPDYSDTFVFQNDFSALLPDVPAGAASDHELLRSESESGLCRVICFSPRHDLTLAEMDAAAIRRVVDLWTEQYDELGAMADINHVQIFENKGAVMGCSNPHPHGQIWAQRSIPGEPAKELTSMREYFDGRGTTLLSDYLAVEINREERIVCGNKHFVALVPFWAVWPFEVIVLCRRTVASLSELSDSEKNSLSDILKRVATRYDNLFQCSFPYSAGLHQAPTDGEAHPECDLHMHFYPPLLRSATVQKFMVGYEMLANPQRDITPESSAAQLRGLSDIHFKHQQQSSMAASHSEIVESLVEGFESRFGDSNDLTFAMAPGRVNLIGEYTDLNDGYVLPMTVDRGVYIAVRKRSDKRIRVASIRYDELVEYDLEQFTAPTPGSWSSYVLGVAEELRLSGLVDSGFELVVDGNLDLGAGLSSSAALEVATAVSLQQVFGFEMGAVEMVKLCQHVEHNYANVLCGIMDQFACGIGRRDNALFLDCRSLEYDSVPVVLGDYRIVIVNSEVKRSLASSAYNTRRAECQEAVEHFRRYNKSVGTLRDVSFEMFEAYGDELSPAVRRRCQHVLTENRRVLAAVVSLRIGALPVFGKLMSESHNSLRDDFEVSCPELDLLVQLALDTDGVLGSRMTGAGFGGCTVNLVHKDAVTMLEYRLNTDYTARFNLTPGIFVLEGNLEAGPINNT